VVDLVESEPLRCRAGPLQRVVDGATLHVLHGDSHFANVHVPEKVTPPLADALGISADLVPKR
jgi:hypothetical protein